MASAHTYLAIDLGAERGRAIAATLEGHQLSLNEVHRFGNDPVSVPAGFLWEILRLWDEIKAGIGAAVKRDMKLDGIGVDTL